MPFPKRPRHDFTVSTISTADPNQLGVYGIFSPSQCIYIGTSEDIQKSLLQHINGKSNQSACIFENNPQYWLAAIIGKSELNLWKRILLKEFRPLCGHTAWEQR